MISKKIYHNTAQRLFNRFVSYLVIFVLSAISVLASSEMENERFIVRVSETGAISFFDNAKQIEWGTNFPGWIELSDDKKLELIPLTNCKVNSSGRGNAIQISFEGINGIHFSDPNFILDIQVELLSDYFDITICQLKCKYQFKKLEYPAQLLTVKTGVQIGSIVAPNLQGIMIPSRYDAGFMRYGQNIWEAITDIENWWTFESGNLNMPWFGASVNQSSVLAYLLTSSDCQLHLIGNAMVGKDELVLNNRNGNEEGTRRSSVSPVWLSSHHHLAYSRKIRYQLVENGYVGMAKKYREYAINSGRYVTLKDKIKKNPEYEKIIGAPDLKIYCYTNRKNIPQLKSWSEPVLDGYTKVNTTFGQVVEIANELKKSGIEKCLILLAGWNRMGYDREHVDMWSPAEKCGGIVGLQKACKTVKNNGYLFALHDNYDDFYPDAPSFDEKFILRDADGSMHKGGIWDGGLCYITCPAKREILLNRNMKLVQNSIPLNAYYFDVITNTSHYECYDERHPLTRKQDLKCRLGLLKNISDRRLVIGGERGTDWAMPEIAFCEGLSGGGTGFHQGIVYRTGISIPLFYLVYHDCAVGYWQHGTPEGREDHANHVLLDLLYAEPSSWSFEYDQFKDLLPLIKNTYDLLSPLHCETAFSEMLSHEVLTDDYMVQHSIFSNGSEVFVNFGITTYQNSKINLPPKGFQIWKNNKPEKEGVFSRVADIVNINN